MRQIALSTAIGRPLDVTVQRRDVEQDVDVKA